MQHFGTKYNAALADETRARYEQAAREGAALNGLLGKNAQILALSEVYKELRAAGEFEKAEAVKAQALAIVEGV